MQSAESQQHQLLHCQTTVQYMMFNADVRMGRGVGSNADNCGQGGRGENGWFFAFMDDPIYNLEETIKVHISKQRRVVEQML